MGFTENILKEKGITLEEQSIPMILPLRQEGNLLFLSGHGCEGPDGKPLYVGRIGKELTMEEGKAAARHCGMRLLSTLKTRLGTLDRVEEIVKVLGFVNSAVDFYSQPAVMNGFSELMIETFGIRGQHARSAIGTSVLPNNQAIEIEMIVRIKE